MRAFKVFDSEWKCRGYEFTGPGTEHQMEGELELCANGFHSCRKLIKCFNYYQFNPKNKVAEIEIIGDIVGDPDDKEATNGFRIVRELTWADVLSEVNTGVANSGKENSGDRNSGNWNSGNWNSGNRNSGDLNSGDWNSGNWNGGDRNSGDLNSNYPDLFRVFNKWIPKAEYDAINWPDFFWFGLTVWVSFDTSTEDERKEYKKEIETCGGFLKTLEYKEAWKLSWGNASLSDREKVKKIPGFDADIFFDITGIRVE